MFYAADKKNVIQIHLGKTGTENFPNFPTKPFSSNYHQLRQCRCIGMKPSMYVGAVVQSHMTSWMMLTCIELIGALCRDQHCATVPHV